MVVIGNEWDEILKDDFKSEYYSKIRDFLKNEYATRRIYPSMYDIFNALKLTSYSDVRVVILGQDPYHGYGQAHGLAFSVKEGVAIPPSLVNIFKEMHDDLGIDIPKSGCLESWAKSGVLLLNTVLTVREGQANSHKGIGWEIFTDNIIKALNDRKEPIVFMLWGANARSKKVFITSKQHLVLEAPHPSPLSAYQGFFGCKHFSKAKTFLENTYKE